nr:uncharacterized protein LOC129463533 [Symphalangus syndactylus]
MWWLHVKLWKKPGKLLALVNIFCRTLRLFAAYTKTSQASRGPSGSCSGWLLRDCADLQATPSQTSRSQQEPALDVGMRQHNFSHRPGGQRGWIKNLHSPARSHANTPLCGYPWPGSLQNSWARDVLILLEYPGITTPNVLIFLELLFFS